MTDRPTDDAPVILTISEAAAVLRVSQRTLHRYIADGKITVLRTPGGHPRVKRSDLDAVLAGDVA